MARKLKFDITIDANALLCPNPNEFYSKAYISEDIVGNYRTLAGIKYKTKIFYIRLIKIIIRLFNIYSNIYEK